MERSGKTYKYSYFVTVQQMPEKFSLLKAKLLLNLNSGTAMVYLKLNLVTVAKNILLR